MSDEPDRTEVVQCVKWLTWRVNQYVYERAGLIGGAA